MCLEVEFRIAAQGVPHANMSKDGLARAVLQVPVGKGWWEQSANIFLAMLPSTPLLKPQITLPFCQRLLDRSAGVADANRSMREACAGAQGSAACAAAKQAYQSAFRNYNKQNPLPPIPKFETVRPEIGPLLLGIIGCGAGLGSAGGGGFGATLTAAGCAYTARDLGNLFIPEQRRIP